MNEVAMQSYLRVSSSGFAFDELLLFDLDLIDDVPILAEKLLKLGSIRLRLLVQRLLHLKLNIDRLKGLNLAAD
jgi:hypothetical protein